MKKTGIIFLLVLLSSGVFAQSKAEKLFKSKQWQELAAMKSEAKRLSGRDLYRIGQANMHTKNDTAAIRMFNAAINKGYNKGDLYYNLGQTYNHNKQYNHAIEALDNALFLVPDRKPYLLEKGAAYYAMQNPDSALATYRYVQSLYPKNQFSAYMICFVLHDMEKYNQCLKCYYNSLHKFLGNNKYYRLSLESIARLEWHENLRYDKAEKAVLKLIKAYPKNYEYQMWLVQLYNIQNNFVEADSVDQVIMSAYTNSKLPSKFYKKRNYQIDAYDLDAFNYLEVFKWFRPKKTNVYYTIFVFSPATKNLTAKLIVQTFEGGYSIYNSKIEENYDICEELTYESLKLNMPLYFMPRPEIVEPDSMNIAEPDTLRVTEPDSVIIGD